MKPTLALLLLVLAITSDSQTKPGSAASKPKPAPPYIKPVFHLPIEWSKDVAHADLDCDGRPDAVSWGKQQVTRYYFYGGEHHPQKAAEVVIEARLATGRKTNQEHIPFLKTTGYYGFCSGPRQLERQKLSCEWEGGKLPGCNPGKKCEALRITDECAEFLLFWEGKRRELTLVRPRPKAR